MPSGHVNQATLKPLSEHALDELRRIRDGVVQPYRVNPGVRNRLCRGDLIIERERLGARWLEITDAGRKALVQKDSPVTELPPSYTAALAFLAGRKWATPADIGNAIAPDARGGLGMTAQGAGRMGGRTARRLMDSGLVADASWRRNGFPAYSITDAGREALAEKKD